MHDTHLDLGDVLFTWNATTPTSIPPETLRKILISNIWVRYECGKLTEEEYYRLVAQQYGFTPEEVACAFQHARDSLQPDDRLISFIKQLKAELKGNLRVFAMSNVSQPDYDVLRSKPTDWSIFDHVFTSAAAGMRKPNLCFYQHVLQAIGCNTASTVYVDDKPENVLAAKSLGIHGVVFDNPENLQTTLRYLMGDPLRRGREYLDSHAGKLFAVTETGLTIEDTHAELLILEITQQW